MMKKRLLCLVFALFMILSSTQVFAAKRDEFGGETTTESTTTTKPIETTKKIGNILASFGSFNKASDLNYFTYNPNGRVEVTHLNDGGATGNGGCVKIQPKVGNAYASIVVPLSVGDVYDITFYAKADKEGSMQFIPLMGSGSGQFEANITPGQKFTTKWKKYSTTYTCDNVIASTKAPVGGYVELFNLRWGNDGLGSAIYLDEVSVTPRGNGNYDWSKYVPRDKTKTQDYIPADDGFSTPQPEKNTDFSDTKNHWARNSISTLASSGYVQGMGDGTFAPESKVTRAQFITMALNLFGFQQSSYKGIYSDVSANQWFANTIQTAYELGFVDENMTSGGKFKPDNPITREEAAFIISKAAKRKKADSSGQAATFTDEGEISGWASQYVKDVSAYGIVGGYPDGSFGPKKNITRAEAATMIFRTVELNSRFAFYVDGVNGNDNNDGTQTKPLKTIDGARKKVQAYLKDMQHHIYVYIKEGTYSVNAPIRFTPADSGSNGYSVIYTSMGAEQPVISGGKDYSGFTLHDAEKNIYKVYVGKNMAVRQAYINGVRGIRARTEMITNDADRVLTNAKTLVAEKAFVSDDLEYVNFKNKSDMEFVFSEQWTNPRIRVEDIIKTSDGQAKFVMHQTAFSEVMQNHSVSVSYPIYIENAYELLDTKGEWYLNKQDGYLYYKPRDYEDPATMVVTIPRSEIAITVAGNSSDDKIHNIKFNNLSFKYYTWSFPSTSGFINDHQGNQIAAYAGDHKLTGGKEDAAMIVADAAYVDITNCTFTKLGGAGVNFRRVFQNCNVIGNEFYDISATGINMGLQLADCLDYFRLIMPEKSRYQDFKIYNKVMNNLIYDVGLEYESSPGINISSMKHSQVSHNEIYNTGYCGVHIGYGWENYPYLDTKGLEITHNYIHDTFTNYIYDGGCIYSVGRTIGDENCYNRIANNYLENQRNPYAPIYPDEGSSWWEVTENVVDLRDVDQWYRINIPEEQKWMHLNKKNEEINTNKVYNNYSTIEKYNTSYPMKNVEGAHVYKDGNWPAEAQKIVNEAGFEPDYLWKYPDSVRNLRLEQHKEWFNLGRGETLQMEVVGAKRKNNEVNIPYSDLYFYSSNENAATVDENGLIKVVGSGMATIYVEYLDGDSPRRQRLYLICDEQAASLKTNVSAINVLKDSSVTITATATTTLGNTRGVDRAEFAVDDASIASVSAEGKVVGLSYGKTVVHATYYVGDVVFKKDFPVTVIAYVQNDTAALIAKSKKLSLGDPLFDPAKWLSGALAGDGGSVKVSKNGGPCYFGTPIGNELISFDFSINDPHGWPTLALKAQDTKYSYTGTDTYMIGFKPDFIEVQRFNKGVRTMILGEEQYAPIGGPGYPLVKANGEKLFEYGKTYSITIGAIDQADGVRLILAVNGEPLFDYLDNTEGYIKGEGYMGVYEYSGSFNFSPFTDKK